MAKKVKRPKSLKGIFLDEYKGTITVDVDTYVEFGTDKRSVKDIKRLKTISAKLQEVATWLEKRPLTPVPTLKKVAPPAPVYKDPLHVNSAELVVSYLGIDRFILNKRLMDQQNCWENLDKIKKLHVLRLQIEDQMVNDADPVQLDFLVSEWTQNQFDLQEAWKFPLDAKFHRFWDIPACRCAKLDNNDAYPTGYYSISGGCKLHGRHLVKG